MLRTLAILIVIAATNSLEAKGRFWAYTMKGTVYEAGSKEPLKHTTLVIGRDTVTTDSLGFYRVTSAGVTCDKGGRSRINRCNREAYGHLVIQRLGATNTTRIKSHWKRYAFCNGEENDCPSFSKDLYVP